MAVSRADIDAILATFEASDWRTIHLKADGVEVMLSKDGGEVTPPAPPPAATAAPPQEPISEQPGPNTADATHDGVEVFAPSLGSFYRAPKPGATPFTDVGTRVSKGDDLCLIEVMKLFTSVTAPCDGVVAAILADDGDLVEHGQPLFRIAPHDQASS
ncbi:biotin/lipoyl-containing protein [Erythrobacter sp.]|nr:biotin/lipoyl-containing protein [Erythrobacter sp.]MBO6525426.1 biotin/lipoyl-binding protein [Erythrobacter sp.]MBO6529901.1 biotin/lipoyl-binding protein [Erythrobacter sp.]